MARAGGSRGRHRRWIPDKGPGCLDHASSRVQGTTRTPHGTVAGNPATPRVAAGRSAARSRAAHRRRKRRQPAERVLVQAIALVTLDRTADDARILQDLEVLGHGRLGEWQDIDEVAGHAGAPPRQLRDDADTRRVAEGAEDLRRSLFFAGQGLNCFHGRY